jgi:hypothetical protein
MNSSLGISFPVEVCSSTLLRKRNQPLLATVPFVAADEPSRRGCDQRDGAVTFVAVRHSFGAAKLHPQTRLGAVEHRFSADREGDGMGGRIDAEAGDVFEFLCKLPAVRQLEHADAKRHELVGIKDTFHRTQAFASIRWVASAAARAPG